ncbi:thiopurine S-methyltransferase [Oceanisphaera pacifica]|uniref:Thiopurine S-methyltransferase n=1 Tax=Oceanisphaera pacifica TaxID=2818389 RepID=A0ABS3NDM5_9GAMM|nr:thiopurine S-methyltransferase [Oceanisphaera pacifica]MBO1518693.1 thiopurine S-methyltransferase [Oceanisphaera pacifica]
MEADFWHQRWQSARIGFHREQVNSQLKAHWPTLSLPTNSQVLVPLCGKTNDMHWLAEQGHQVVGVELSPLAVQDFFADSKLTPKQAVLGPYQGWLTPHINLYQGDFFKADQLNITFNAAYDRAALIALPASMRHQYVAQLARLLKPGAVVLLISVHYAPDQQQGPPFSVSEQAVTALFEPYFTLIEVRPTVSEQTIHPRVASGELDFFDEICFVLVRKEHDE